jgi:hypothetical protein
MTEVDGKGLAKQARAALERRLGHAMTDTEWERARTTLIEFVIILRDWEQKEGAREAVQGLPRAA